jgi:hypothetical protein
MVLGKKKSKGKKRKDKSKKNEIEKNKGKWENTPKGTKEYRTEC